LQIPKPPSKRRSFAVTKLDMLVSKIVRARDPYCVTCGTTENLSCSHWIPRRFWSVRWDLRNCNTQCFACNGAHSNGGDGTPLGEAYAQYMREHWGSEVMVELLYSKPRKVRLYELEGIYEGLKEKAKELGIW
jgi:hypothetical protein